VQSETTLVWAEGGIELHTVATVDLDLVLVVLPDDAELDDTLRDGDDFEGDLVFGVLFEESAVFEGGDQLCVVPCQPCPGQGREIRIAVVRSYLCRPARTRARKEGWT
jgi:hypothetical protein